MSTTISASSSALWGTSSDEQRADAHATPELGAVRPGDGDTGEALRRTLARVERRLRANRAMKTLAVAATIGMAVLAVVAVVNGLSGGGLVPRRPAIVLIVVAVCVCAVASALRRESPERVAAAIDKRVGLEDEVRSAWWFLSSGPLDAWRSLQVRRASSHAPEEDVIPRFPVRVPRRWGWALGAAALLISSVTVPWGATRDLAVGGHTGENEIADATRPEDLRDAGPQTDDGEPADAQEDLEPESPWDQELDPGQGESQEESDPDAETAEGDQGTATDPGEAGGEAASPDDATATDDSATEESPETEGGERSAGGRPRPDEQVPADAAPLVPASDEVFLQEAGAPPDTADDAEENVGHATATPDGAQELPEGEVTRLDVQLEMEMLEAARVELERGEEEPVEEVTRQERSTVEFARVDARAEFDEAEIVDRDVIPWPYRDLVLEYFRAIRAREKSEYEQRRAKRERDRDRAPDA